ncbi:Asp23/Gls24 family envelope stress response protein [Streptomyces sp. NPDC056835]|uniref:Asp23/Gls24 family envelope stress response protein n=1 Tax=Streptomyces sp. NPDC056835 TaxID=3345956 RepID=UPI0036BAA4DA
MSDRPSPLSDQPSPRPFPGGRGDSGTGTPSLPAPALRGATLIPGTVVARIAARAAREALRLQREALSHPGGGEPPARLGGPRSTATVHDGSACLGISLDLPYPIDIARTCGEIRHYIAERVDQLTGMRIDDVTVSVRRLVPGESLRRGRVQ